MFIKKFMLRAAGISLAAIALLTAQPLCAESSSDTARLEKLERAVEQLQKQNGALEQRNAELEQKISVLEKRTASAPDSAATRQSQKTASVPDAKFKTKVTYDGKTYVEKAVVEDSKPPIYVVPRGTELKLVLGGFIQANVEGGAAFAFNGNFGQTAINDRFRLRRARINLTGDFAEQFDFKMEGDFQQNDGTNGGRTDFSATDIFINWHQFPAAQIKVGQYKAPFGLDQLTPDTTLFTIERTLPTGAITPERQIGVELWGKPLTNIWPEQKDLLTYYAGVFNGNGRNINTNDDNYFMYVGRLELMPVHGKIFGQDSFLKLGGDVLNSRDEKGVNISESGNLLVNTDGSLSPFTLPSADERTAWSVDAWFELGRFDLIGEYLLEHVQSRNVVGGTPFNNFTTDGFYVTGAYFILPKKLQAVVQWQYLNPGQKGNDGLYSILGGLNYYIHGDDLKLMVNYIHTWSDFREVHPQFGDDQFDEVIGRVQLMF